jgi:predicted GH43/DUF377 family glycosyl hydrolase
LISAQLLYGSLRVSCHRLGVIMQPDGTDSQREGVLNPGVARDRQHNLLLFPRLVAAGNVSTIGLVRVGKDLQVERVSVILEPQTNYEIRDQPGGYGCEDSRVTYIAELDQYVMAYTAFGPSGARIAVAASSDAYMWTRLGLIEFHDDGLNAVDNKDAAFFPEVVLSPNGIPSIAFFHRPMRPETINGQTPIPIILALPPQERESICIAYVPLERVRYAHPRAGFPSFTPSMRCRALRGHRCRIVLES